MIAVCFRTKFPSPGNRGPQQLRNVKPKNELTGEKFFTFLEWLSPDLERAGDEYERLRFRLFTFFSHRQCCFADELTDETINRVVLKASEENIESKIAYCYGVAKNVYREWLRKQRTHLDINEVQIAAKDPDEPGFPSECLDKCLQELPPESRTLLLDYFSEEKTAKIDLHQRLSQSMKMTQTALRMRVMRAKGRLKICVEQCMNLEGVTEAF